MINDKGDPKREVNKRISESYLTWKRLSEFWKHADCSVRLKLSVYDAVIRAKLMYGLESVQINDSLKKKINAFQFKGLRQILKISTTYVNRQHSNAYVFEVANATINSWHERRRTPPANPGDPQRFLKRKQIVPMSEYYEETRRHLIVKILSAHPRDPIRQICVDEDTWELKE